MKKNTTNHLKQFRKATHAVMKRTMEIGEAARNSAEEAAKLFSEREIHTTNEICIAFLEAVADLPSIKCLKDEKKLIEQLRDTVLETNDSLSILTRGNPRILNMISDFERTALDNLLTCNPMIKIAAGLAKCQRHLVQAALSTHFSSLRRLLELPANEPVMNKYKAAILFARHLYKNHPSCTSWPKTIAYIRTCSDKNDPNFPQCIDVRVLAQTSAKNDKLGVEKFWNSFKQRVKPSDGRKKSKMDPVPILDKGIL